MNSWSLLYDELGMYAVNDDPNNPYKTAQEITLTVPKPNSPCKYNEEKILKEVEEYILGTYRAHYTSDNGIQTLDLIESCGDAAAFCRSNILKYASRYDKKGSAKMDVKKIIHYAVLLYHFANLDTETNERGYETF